jgi:hypothetical protein
LVPIHGSKLSEQLFEFIGTAVNVTYPFRATHEFYLVQLFKGIEEIGG